MIYLLRHAERMDQSKNTEEKDAWFKSLRCKNNPYDIPLSLNGISQAYSGLNKILKGFQGNFDYIYCSPMTRCVQTALQFQKYIYDKFKKLVLIRVEFGLAVHLFKEYEMFWLGINIKFKDDKFIVTKLFEFVDKYLDREKIYKRYGIRRFDIGYKGIISREQINQDQTYTESIGTRIDTIKKIAQSVDKSKLTIICAHCETCHLIYNWVNKKWLSTKDSPKYGYVGGLKLGLKSNRMIFLEMIPNT